MNGEYLQTALDEALDVIGNNLLVTWRTFGSGDFPEDGGVAERNELWKFPNTLLGAEFRTHGPAKDHFLAKNGEHLQRLNVRQLVALTGCLHFYSNAYYFCRAAPHSHHNFAYYSRRLDWIMNMYAATGTVSKSWFAAGKVPEKTFWQEIGIEKMYYEVSSILGVNPRDEENAHVWGGLAHICLRGYEFVDEQWHQECARIFDS